jgi:hypothetical protein
MMKTIAASFCALALSAAVAGNAWAASYDQGKVAILPAPAAPLFDTANFTVDQTFQSTFKAGHGYNSHYEFNNVTNTWHYEVDAQRRIPLDDGSSLRLGIDAHRYDFGDNRSKAPNILQSYAVRIGWDSFEEGQPGFSVQSDPGLYFSHKLDVRDFDAPTTAKVFLPTQDPSFFWVGGARVSLQSNYPILPLAGMLWHIDPMWDLEAFLPAPRLVCHYSQALTFQAGGEITGGSFRYDNRGKADYYEVRTGLGMNYKLGDLWALNLDTGAALQRNYKLRNSTEETKPAPYSRLTLNMLF